MIYAKVRSEALQNAVKMFESSKPSVTKRSLVDSNKESREESEGKS
jgi:hypothetical protein